MRIGMIADAYRPVVSGVTNYVFLNKRLLEANGHQVYVFTFGESEYKDDEPNIIRSPGLPLVDTGYYLSLNFKREARKLLYTMDVVHVHHPFFGGSLALRYCRPRGIPIIFTNHTRYDLYAQFYLPGVPDIISETMLQAYMPSFCRACDLIIAPSEGLRQILIKMGVDAPIEVVPNGVNLEPFSNPTIIKDRAEFNFTSEHILLVYVGRLGPEKNLPFLLRSFAVTSQALDHVRLLLIGGGPERDNLEDQVRNMGIEPKVFFTGMVPYEELPGYLAMADSFVTASVSEVHPLSVIEAMASGLPVLGINSPGVSDTIEDGSTGFLATDDLAAFTAKMVRMVSEHDLRKSMGIKAKEASKTYDIQRTSHLMEERYRRMVQNTSGRKSGLRASITRFFDTWRP
jgi:1,2-diacylglycerol 3-alpha-glucosyltransferase